MANTTGLGLDPEMYMLGAELQRFQHATVKLHSFEAVVSLTIKERHDCSLLTDNP